MLLSGRQLARGSVMACRGGKCGRVALGRAQMGLSKVKTTRYAKIRWAADLLLLGGGGAEARRAVVLFLFKFLQ